MKKIFRLSALRS